MTFTKSPGSGAPLLSSPGQEIAALRKRRLTLISELAALADTISRIDNRLNNLRIYEEMVRPGETGKETAEAAASESTKTAREA